MGISINILAFGISLKIFWKIENDYKRCPINRDQALKRSKGEELI